MAIYQEKRRVQHAPVLHVRAIPDRDRLGVAAQHRPVPNARLLAEAHPSDDEGAGGDERARGGFGGCVAEGEQGPDAAYTSTSTAPPVRWSLLLSGLPKMVSNSPRKVSNRGVHGSPILGPLLVSLR